MKHTLKTRSQIPQISEYAPFDLNGETHEQYIQLDPENVTIFMARYIQLHIYMLLQYIWSVSSHS